MVIKKQIVMETWYYLDPDNNKDDPKNGLFCARCKRKIKETQSFESFQTITIHPENPWFKLDIYGTNTIGSECLKKVVEEYGIM